MTRYRVNWVIDIEAANPQEAAREALRVQRKPDSIATVFEVSLDDGTESVRVDLNPEYA